MKKIIFALLFCLVASGANAYWFDEDERYVYTNRLSDPFYTAGLGWFNSETSVRGERDISGDSNTSYYAEQTLTIAFGKGFYLGGGIGYKQQDSTNTDDFLNPFALGRARLLDRIFKIDVLAKVTFDVFDTAAEGGIESGTQKYEGAVLFGPRFTHATFALKVMYQYWNKGSEIINATRDNQSNMGGAGVVSFRPFERFDAGGEVGFLVYDAFESKDENLFYFNINANFEIIKEYLEIGAFYDFKKYKEIADKHALGVKLRASF